MAKLAEQKQGPQLWYLLNLAMWWKHYIAEEPLAAGLPAAPADLVTDDSLALVS